MRKKLMYQLWDTETGNAVDGFATREKALAAVRESLDHHGEGYVAGLALAKAESADAFEVVAEGDDLVELVRLVKR
jgi:hypothetical protein